MKVKVIVSGVVMCCMLLGGVVVFPSCVRAVGNFEYDNVERSESSSIGSAAYHQGRGKPQVVQQDPRGQKRGVSARKLQEVRDGESIPSVNAPLYCQDYFGPCYLMARTMVYNTFSPGFTTPDEVKAANGGSYYMQWGAVGSPGLSWVHQEYRLRWDSEVKAAVDVFLRAGKPVIIQGITKKGYQHASVLVGKEDGEYLINDSAACAKDILFSSVWSDGGVWGAFFYDYE